MTGIQMRNKGSQAMFLSLYWGLKSIYKDCEVTGFAFKVDAPDQYAFKLLPYDDYTRFLFKYHLNDIPLLTPILTYLASRLKKNDKWNGTAREMTAAIRDADAIFDASGYTLGSGWSKKGGRRLLDTIKTAKRYDTKIILMPQSFGPFDWGTQDDDADFLEEVKEGLQYASRIYAREREGYECLKSLGLKNVELSADLVIREKFFPDADQILADHVARNPSYPDQGSVGFIVNENLFRVGDPDTVLDLYARMLDKLADDGEKVYILTTSTVDEDLVEGILAKTRNRAEFNLISGEYSSPELIDMIARFKYVVASRYHSVVFAYRNAVPAIILGWATKYSDLALHFGQQDYVFDIRNADVDGIIDQIEKMGANYETESQRIRDRLEDIQATSVVQEAVAALQG
ncbi:MAG: polysaccharide pyruvyl transferase family protein [Allopontixanthobacter sediminis]